jgi:exodeoxyribonuclease VIII
MIKTMSELEYRSHPAMSQSTFKDFITGSPQKFHHANKPEVKAAKQTTDAMILGSVTDGLYLEGHLFDEKFSCIRTIKDPKTGKQKPAPKIASRSPAVQTRIKELKLQGKQGYLESHKVLADAIVAGLPKAILPAQEQRQIIGIGEMCGVPCRGMADWIDDDGYIWDLKTTAVINDFYYKAKASTSKSYLGYDIQAAWYYTLFQELKPKGFRWLVVESDAPYDYKIYEASDKTLADAQYRIMDALEEYKQCLATDEWPGYDKNPEVI